MICPITLLHLQRAMAAIRNRFFGPIGRNGEESVRTYSTEPPL